MIPTEDLDDGIAVVCEDCDTTEGVVLIVCPYAEEIGGVEELGLRSLCKFCFVAAAVKRGLTTYDPT